MTDNPELNPTEATTAPVSEAAVPEVAVPEATVSSKKSLVPSEQIAYSLEMARQVARAAAENRGQDVVVLDLTSQTALFDFFVIATGTSRRQLGAMAEEIDRALKEMGEKKLSAAGFDEGRWAILDYGSIVVHLFDEETRGFYDLESLWADGKEVDISDILRSATTTMARRDQ